MTPEYLNDKRPDAAVPLTPLLAERWSPRAFRTEEPPADDFRALLEAARWAPSANNEQPWRIIAGRKQTSPDAWRALFDCLMDDNKLWCERAPILLLFCAKERYSNRDVANFHYTYDTGQAAAHLSIEAMSRSLYVHQMAGFFRDKVREAVAIPEGFAPVAMMAVGYIDDAAILPEKQAASERAPRRRRPLADTAWEGRWESPLC